MSIRPTDDHSQHQPNDALTSGVRMRTSKPRFSLPNWKRRLSLTLTIATVLGGAIYGCLKQPATLYEANARVLLLSQQEQYLVTQTAVVAEASSSGVDGEAFVSLLPLRTTAQELANEFDLASDPYFARRSWLDNTLAFIGAELLVSKTSAQLLDNITQSIHIEHQPKKRIIKLTFLAPDADQAAEVANRLADSYLAKLKSNQQEELQSAVDKLAGDVEQLTAHRHNLRDRIRLIQTQMNRTSLSASEPVLADSDQLASLIAQERAQASMLARMMSRQREAETRLELDLLPPKARILSQAVAPERSLRDPAALYGLLVALLFVSLNAIRWMRLMAKRPVEISSSTIKASPPQPLKVERRPADQKIEQSPPDPESTQPMEPRAKKLEPKPSNRLALHRLALSGLGGHVADIARLASRHTSKRVVLISEESDWGGLGTDTVKSFAKAELRVVHVSLDEHKIFNGYQGAKLRVGLTDLIDDLAKGGDLIHCDDQTGACSVTIGYRSLKASDFSNEKLDNFLQALETVFDLVLVDLGPFYSDEQVLRSFGRGRSSVACIHAPLPDMNLIPQINAVMTSFGYSDSLILPLGPRFLKRRLAEMRRSTFPVAAE